MIGLGRHPRPLVAVGLLGIALIGCAAQAARPVGRYGNASAAQSASEEPGPTVTSTVLAVLATPVYFAFKAAVCAATAVIATPAMAMASITDPDGRGWQRQDLAEGFDANCGPPYYIKP